MSINTFVHTVEQCNSGSSGNGMLNTQAGLSFHPLFNFMNINKMIHLLLVIHISCGWMDVLWCYIVRWFFFFARGLPEQAFFMAAVKVEAHFDPPKSSWSSDLWPSDFVFEIISVHAAATMISFAVCYTCLCSVAEPENTANSVYHFSADYGNLAFRFEHLVLKNRFLKWAPGLTAHFTDGL